MVTHADRTSWLRARRIGSSDVPALLGLSSHRGPWDVWRRLVEGEVDDSDSPAAARGRLLEPVVLRRYVAATGRDVRPPPPHSLWTRDDWASATPDAIGTDLVVEAKTDRRRDRWGEPGTIERWEPGAEAIVRPEYWAQVQHQLWVLDLQVADLAVLLPGDDPLLPELRVYRLHRDEEAVAAMVERLSAWWARHVVGREPPELDGSPTASQWLARPGAGSTRASRPATPAEAALAAAYVAARRAADHWDQTRRLIGQQLVAAAGDHHRLELPTGGSVSQVFQPGRTTLDEGALLADHPELRQVLDRYRRQGPATAYPLIRES